MAKKTKKKALVDQCLSYLKDAITDNILIVNNAEENLEAYRRDPYGNEVEGRSAFVTSDVADTVEWIMPSLMKLFYGGTNVVQINPTSAADDKKAKLMNAKVNFDFMQEQNGFILLHDWFKAALLNKLSVVKYWWDSSVDKVKHEYEDLTEMEMRELLDTTLNIIEDSVEVTVNEIDEASDMEDAEPMYDLAFFTEEERSYPMCELLPPEEVVFEIRSKIDLAHAEFVGHKKKVHKNYLKSKYGVSEKDLQSVSAEFMDDENLTETRFEDVGGINFITDDVDSDFYYIYECYINDYDEEGEPIPKKVVVFGDKELKVEDNDYGRPNFCCLSSIRLPHRAAGMSISDMVTDLQKLRTALVRAVMDNIYYQNNGINVVNPFRINMDDVVGRREPGASWRTLDDIDPQSAIMPVPQSPLAPHTMQMMDYTEQMREKRTGVSMTQQGLDPNTLNNNASGAVSAAMNAANQRIELIARVFAETGVRDLFQQYVEMNKNYLSKTVAVKVDDEWAEISPNDIQGKFDVLVDVGVGTAAKEVQLTQLITLIQTAYPQAMELGVVTGENYYNTLTEIYSLMGYKNTMKFASNPQQDTKMQQIHQQYQQQIDQLKQVVQAQHVELQKTDLDKEIDQQKLELERINLMLKEKQMELKYKVDVAKNIIAPANASKGAENAKV